MLLKKYFNHECITVIPIEPYGRLIGTSMELPEWTAFHFDPDPLYRETVLSQGWDPEKDISPKNKEYVLLQKKSKEWLANQKRK